MVVCLVGGLCAHAEEPGRADGPLGAAREPLGRLIAPVLRDGRLVLDRSSWPTGPVDDFDVELDREERRRQLAQDLGVPVEAVPDHLIDGDGPGSPNPLPPFHEVMRTGGGRPGGGSGHGAARAIRRVDGSDMEAWIEFDSKSGSFSLGFVERTGRHRSLDVDEEPDGGTSIRLAEPGAGFSLILATTRDGAVSFIGRMGEAVCALAASDVPALFWDHPDEVSRHLLRPLAELGIPMALDRCLPEVVAAATSGYCAAPPAIAGEADDWIAMLSDDEASMRERASQALAELYPRAIRHVHDAAERSTDPESRDRLRAVIDARPDIAAALDYVKAAGLKEDRAYLLEVLGRSPSYRASARARLAELYGEDHGDDPAAWPAPK